MRLRSGLGLIGLLALYCATPAMAQWRMTTNAAVGIDQIPIVVHDLEAASTTWRNLGFTVKDGSTADNGVRNSHVKFEDGAGVQLFTVPAAVDDETERYRDMLEEAEGPVRFALHARDLNMLRDAIDGNRRFGYGTVSRTFTGRGLDFLFVVQDSREPDDRAYIVHPNGAKAMSRVWIAMDNGRSLNDLLVAAGGEAIGAKVYTPEATQSYDITVTNGEVLVLPRSRQLTRGRPIIGATFEVEDLEVTRRRLELFGVPWTWGGTENLSIIVAPDATHGMWVEFRE